MKLRLLRGLALRVVTNLFITGSEHVQQGILGRGWLRAVGQAYDADEGNTALCFNREIMLFLAAAAVGYPVNIFE
jgi:hypothetical protein